jgi:hypothetical protein
MYAGQYMPRFRETKGWRAPCLVVSVDKNMTTIVHENTHATAGITSAMPFDQPSTFLLNPDQCTFDYREEYPHSLNDNCLNTEHTTTTAVEEQDA